MDLGSIAEQVFEDLSEYTTDSDTRENQCPITPTLADFSATTRPRLTVFFHVTSNEDNSLFELYKQTLDWFDPDSELFTTCRSRGGRQSADKQSSLDIQSLALVLSLNHSLAAAKQFLSCRPWKFHHKEWVGTQSHGYSDCQDYYTVTVDRPLCCVKPVTTPEQQLQLLRYVSSKHWRHSINLYKLILSTDSPTITRDMCVFRIAQYPTYTVQLALKKLPKGVVPKKTRKTELCFQVSDIGSLVPLFPNVCHKVSDVRWCTKDLDGNRIYLQVPKPQCRCASLEDFNTPTKSAFSPVVPNKLRSFDNTDKLSPRVFSTVSGRPPLPGKSSDRKEGKKRSLPITHRSRPSSASSQPVSEVMNIRACTSRPSSANSVLISQCFHSHTDSGFVDSSMDSGTVRASDIDRAREHKRSSSVDSTLRDTRRSASIDSVLRDPRRTPITHLSSLTHYERFISVPSTKSCIPQKLTSPTSTYSGDSVLNPTHKTTYNSGPQPVPTSTYNSVPNTEHMTYSQLWVENYVADQNKLLGLESHGSISSSNNSITLDNIKSTTNMKTNHTSSLESPECVSLHGSEEITPRAVNVEDHNLNDYINLVWSNTSNTQQSNNILNTSEVHNITTTEKDNVNSQDDIHINNDSRKTMDISSDIGSVYKGPDTDLNKLDLRTKPGQRNVTDHLVNNSVDSQQSKKPAAKASNPPPLRPKPVIPNKSHYMNRPFQRSNSEISPPGVHNRHSNVRSSSVPGEMTQDKLQLGSEEMPIEVELTNNSGDQSKKTQELPQNSGYQSKNTDKLPYNPGLESKIINEQPCDPRYNSQVVTQQSNPSEYKVNMSSEQSNNLGYHSAIATEMTENSKYQSKLAIEGPSFPPYQNNVASTLSNSLEYQSNVVGIQSNNPGYQSKFSNELPYKFGYQANVENSLQGDKGYQSKLSSGLSYMPEHQSNIESESSIKTGYQSKLSNELQDKIGYQSKITSDLPSNTENVSELCKEPPHYPIYKPKVADDPTLSQFLGSNKTLSEFLERQNTVQLPDVVQVQEQNCTTQDETDCNNQASNTSAGQQNDTIASQKIPHLDKKTASREGCPDDVTSVSSNDDTKKVNRKRVTFSAVNSHHEYEAMDWNEDIISTDDMNDPIPDDWQEYILPDSTELRKEIPSFPETPPKSQHSEEVTAVSGKVAAVISKLNINSTGRQHSITATDTHADTLYSEEDWQEIKCKPQVGFYI